MGTYEKEVGVDLRTSPPVTPSRPHPKLESHMMPALTITASQCPTPNEEYDPTSSHPFSAFYSHPTTRTSFEQLKNNSTAAIKVYDTDLESGNGRFSADVPPTTSGTTPRKDCTVWPQKQTLVQRSKELKNSRRCSPLRNLTKKQRIWAKIITGLVIIGAAVGIGIGVSIAVHAGVWKSDGQQQPIGNSQLGS